MRRIIKRILEYEELAILFFPIVVLYIAPIFHELGHILILKLFSCPMNLRMSFSFATGLRGHIEPLCELTPVEAIVTLWSGIFMTLILSLMFFFLARKWRKKVFVPIVMDATALGFFVSSFIDTLLGKGDIFFILKIVEIDVPSYVLSFITAVLILIAFVYFWRSLTEEEEILEEKI